MKQVETIVSIALILTAIIVGGAFAFIATERALTALESILFQSLTLVAGLVGSFVFGRQSAKAAAREMVKPYARSAFRRLMSLYQSLSRLASIIERSQSPNESEPHDVTIARLEAMVIEQISTADDAMEDWRDIVPEDVNELYELMEKRRNIRSKND